MRKVAVYGTLKRGLSNYQLHLEGYEPTADLVASLPFRMFANEAYPMLVPDEAGETRPIRIEVFDVDEAKLEELDALEAPYGYWRESVLVPELDERVEIYLHPAPPPTSFRAVEDGDWRE